MLFGWSMSDWIILVVDVVAVVLIFRFLSWKIKHKLEEVEQRQKFSLRQKKSASENKSGDQETDENGH